MIKYLLNQRQRKSVLQNKSKNNILFIIPFEISGNVL